jgi:collagen type I/II/III/V/XI/XXIV/XXVII alpha
VTYCHVELPFHGIILAEGMPAESYLDTGNRAAFADGGQVLHLHPEFAAGIREARTMAHLVAAGPVLDQVRRSLRARARVAIRAAQPVRMRSAAAPVDARAAAD